MKRILSEIAVLYSLFLVQAGAASPVAHFPAVAYEGERAGFVLNGSPGAVAEVIFNDKLLLSEKFAADALEFSVIFSESGLLLVKCADKTIAFDVVQPGAATNLFIKDGYLRTDRGAAILLAQHRAPRKHDRRWETVRLLSCFMRDKRPAVSSGSLLYDRGESCAQTDDLVKAASIARGFWTSVESGADGIDGLVASAAKLKPADVAVVALSLADHERGIDDFGFRVRLEWILQSLERSGFKHIFVTMPRLSDSQKERLPRLHDGVKLAASANKGTFLPANADRQGHPPSWFKAAIDEMQRIVKCR